MKELAAILIAAYFLPLWILAPLAIAALAYDFGLIRFPTRKPKPTRLESKLLEHIDA